MSFGASAIGTLPYGDGTGGSSIVYYGISLVSPADNSSTGSFYPTFTSLPNSSDGSTIQVEWQWDIDPNFTNVGARRQIKTTLGNVSSTNATTAPDAALYNGPFYWRARAGDGTNWSNYTTSWKLNVASIPMVATAYVYENTGVLPAASKDTAFVVYENTGVAPGHRLTIVRQPRGWGVLPTGPQTIIILDDAAVGTFTTYENTTT